MKAIDLHSVAIIADWCLDTAIKEKRIDPKRFTNEISAAKKLRKIAAKFADDAELTIDEMPF